MELQVFEDYETLSDAAAALMLNVISTKPDPTLCLATGDSPKLSYRLLAEKVKMQSIDTSNCFFIGLDEWLGIAPHKAGSCHHFLQTHVFEPLGIRKNQTHLFDAMTDDPDAECEKMNNLITVRNRIDLMIVGVGMNGHIGFNEPGVDVNSRAHVVTLDATTQKIGQKYFEEPVSIKRGITLGLKQVFEAKKVLMLANGNNKSAIMKKVLKDEISNAVPASFIRQHQDALVMIDKEASSQLTTKN